MEMRTIRSSKRESLKLRILESRFIVAGGKSPGFGDNHEVATAIVAVESSPKCGQKTSTSNYHQDQVFLSWVSGSSNYKYFVVTSALVHRGVSLCPLQCHAQANEGFECVSWMSSGPKCDIFIPCYFGRW
eukprot:5350586-Amphidinium_carterae.1